MRCFPVLVWSSLIAACATGEKPRVTRRSAPMSLPAALAGDWEGVSRSTEGEGMAAGDTRIERQAWRLTQDERGKVRGYYVVELTMVSGDGRPYLCSRAPRFSTLLRFEVRGRVDGGLIELEETGDARSKGSCKPAPRSPSRFRAVLAGDVMTLLDGQRRVLLRRRSLTPGPGLEGETTRPVSPLLAAFDADAGPGGDGPAGATGNEPDGGGFAALEMSLRGGAPSDPPVNLEGLWVWEHRGALPGGDEKLEREEWHLVQEGTKLSGYYDRAVRQISTDGHAYRCNSALDFRVVTRYQITGEIRGSAVALYERAFEIIEASPCDDGRRRLDAYHGLAGPAEIRLMWGVGTQVLRRSRPRVPTERF
jgi:hypothetical protein